MSNETPNIDVYWDNLKVTQKRGRLASEESYYPFGLAMNALSSHAGTIVNNAYKYNRGTELTEDLDVDYYETYLRQYDAQIGRFTGMDVLSEMSFNISTYAYATNDPIYFNDPSGALAAAFPVAKTEPDNAPSEGGETSSDPSGSGWWMDFGWMFSYSGMGGSYGGSGGGGSGYGGGDTYMHGGGGGNSGSNGNTTHKEEPLAPVNDGIPIRLPIFWQEEAYPSIERIDLTYYEYYAPPTQKVDLGGKIVFLLFSYVGPNQGSLNDDNRDESEDSYVGPLNPNGQLFNRHEVPYATTMQGGRFSYSELVSAKQNKGHGSSLKNFYKDNNLKRGDYFLVPLTRPATPVPQPIVAPDFSRKPSITPVSKPVAVGITVGIGFALYEGLKWGAATLLAPETFGGSYIVAGATP